MKLTVWTYEGPPHVGAMRVATAMEGVHYLLHAPQGDTYADLLFTMIERRGQRPPVTYTTFQARDLGGDTANLFKDAARVVGFSYDYAKDLVRNYNANGVAAIRNLRRDRHPPGRIPLLNQEQILALQTALQHPPAGGGDWTGMGVVKYNA